MSDTCCCCNGKGMYPQCWLCGKRKKKGAMTLEEISEQERQKWNGLAHHNFKKTNSNGSGCESFDNDVRETHGDWH